MLRINTCWRNRKNVLRSKAAPIKMYGTCQHKRNLKKRKYTKKILEHVCSTSMCLPQKVLRTSGLYGIETGDFWTFRHNGIRKHLTTTRGGHNTPMTSRYTPTLPLPVPGFRQWRELGSQRPVRDWWKKFASPEGVAHGGNRNHIKDGNPHRNRDLSSIS